MLLTSSSSSAERELATASSFLLLSGFAQGLPLQLEAEQCRPSGAAVPAAPARARPWKLLVTGWDVALCPLPGVWVHNASFEPAELSALPS